MLNGLREDLDPAKTKDGPRPASYAAAQHWESAADGPAPVWSAALPIRQRGNAGGDLVPSEARGFRRRSEGRRNSVRLLPVSTGRSELTTPEEDGESVTIPLIGIEETKGFPKVFRWKSLLTVADFMLLPVEESRS